MATNYIKQFKEAVLRENEKRASMATAVFKNFQYLVNDINEKLTEVRSNFRLSSEPQGGRLLIKIRQRSHEEEIANISLEADQAEQNQAAQKINEAVTAKLSNFELAKMAQIIEREDIRPL